MVPLAASVHVLSNPPPFLPLPPIPIGIVVGAYSPLANPSLGSADDPNPLKDPVVKEIAKKHSVSAAQVSPATSVTISFKLSCTAGLHSISPSQGNGGHSEIS